MNFNTNNEFLIFLRNSEAFLWILNYNSFLINKEIKSQYPVSRDCIIVFSKLSSFHRIFFGSLRVNINNPIFDFYKDYFQKFGE